MNTAKYALLAAVGIAAVLLLTSDTAKSMRDDIEDKAMKNAKKWKNKLARVGSSTKDTLEDLKQLLSSEVEGLSDDARKRIENILNGTTKSASKIRKSTANHVAS